MPGSSSVIVKLRLPRSVAERLEREARQAGLSLEEYLLDQALQGVDPSERARAYIEAAEDLLAQSLEEARKGNVRQAAEKLWGAAALAVKAYAAWREGRRLASHGELWEFKRVMERELGAWVRDSWANAVEMHICFYEAWCSGEDVEGALVRVKKLVEEVKGKVSGGL